MLLLTIGRIRRMATTKRVAKMTPGWSEMTLVIKLKMAFLRSSDVNSIKLSNILCSLAVYLCASFKLDLQNLISRFVAKIAMVKIPLCL